MADDTPAGIRKLAEGAEAKAGELEAEAERLTNAAAVLRGQASTMMRLADEMDGSTRGSLTSALTAVKVNVNKVTDEHRHNIAKGQKPDDKAFMRALVERDFTQRTLAKALKISPALLSMYRKGKRPIPRDRAAKVEELTGWKATPRNWPGRIVS